eukprot:5274513-Amphidinium_carterae.1
MDVEEESERPEEIAQCMKQRRTPQARKPHSDAARTIGEVSSKAHRRKCWLLLNEVMPHSRNFPQLKLSGAGVPAFYPPCGLGV